MEIVGDLPTICREKTLPKMISGKPWLRQTLMVMGSSPRKRCPTCWRVDAWGAVLAVFFVCKRFLYGLFGRKNHGVFVCCFVFGFKKDLEHANFYLFFVGYTTVTWSRYVFKKIGPEMDLKYPEMACPNFTIPKAYSKNWRLSWCSWIVSRLISWGATPNHQRAKVWDMIPGTSTWS